jgi:hypothetical protein
MADKTLREKKIETELRELDAAERRIAAIWEQTPAREVVGRFHLIMAKFHVIITRRKLNLARLMRRQERP